MMLSEISQTKTNIICSLLYVEYEKQNTKLIHTDNKLVVARCTVEVGEMHGEALKKKVNILCYGH